jgi:glycosyltransferase involved in cell wall biosynthesis
MKNILYIHHTADIGGATVKLFELIKYLDRLKYNPSVIFLSDGDAVSVMKKEIDEVYVYPDISIYPHAEGGYFPVKSFRPWYQFSKLFSILPSSFKLKSILLQMDIDLIHINTSPQIPSLIAARIAGIKCIFHLREVLREGVFGLRKYFIQYLISEYSDWIISIAKYNATKIKKSNKLSIIYDSVDLDKFNPGISGQEVRNQYQINNDSFIVGMLGGIIPHKGLSVLISAAGIVNKEIPNIRYIVAGSSPKHDKEITFKRKIRYKLEDYFNIPNPDRDIINLLNENNLTDSFIFTNPQLNISKVIASLDILVFPITESHFGLPIIEAGAMKIPVVASDFPSTREIISDNETGLLVPPNDYKALAKIIILMLSDKEFSKTLAENAYKVIKKDFDVRENIKKVYETYDEILFGNKL